MSLSGHRREYNSGGLSSRDLDPDPIRQFKNWLAQALSSDQVDPTAMTLATAGADGTPAARIVLLKEVCRRGFTFFSDYRSTKAGQLAANPKASLVFYWPLLERQVRVVGTVSRLSGRESDEYFRQRPRGSQLAVLVSHQSQPVASRAELEKKLEEVARQYQDRPVQRPASWGGYLLFPHSVEFWQGRPNRLHDRFLYTREGNEVWKIQRLSP